MVWSLVRRPSGASACSSVDSSLLAVVDTWSSSDSSSGDIVAVRDTGDNVVDGHSAESLRMRAEGRRELLTSLMKAQAILNIQLKWRATRSILFEICVSVQKGQANYASRNGPARYSTFESLLS